MNNKTTICALALVITAVSFYGGIKFDQSQNTASAFGGRGGFRGGQGGMMRGLPGQTGNKTNGGFVSGEVLSIDNASITLKMKDGGSKIIFLSASTSVMKTDTGAISDVSVGKQISVTGNTNADGSVTAQSIQIRSKMMPQPSASPKAPTN